MLFHRFYQSKGFSKDDVLNVIGTIEINGHEVPTLGPLYMSIYKYASFLEHSCFPNISKSFTKSGWIVLWAIKAIPKNTNLSLSYSDTLWGAYERHCHLLHTKHFICNCQRCKDITESNTNYNGIHCIEKQCFGTVNPNRLRNWNQNWR